MSKAASLENKFECGISMLTCPGETVSGDHYLIKFQLNKALFAVIDGAGHGEEAAEASLLAASILEKNLNSSLEQHLKQCHEALRSTRGAAMSLASIHFPDFSMNWVGIGNVEAVSLKTTENSLFIKETLLLRNGIVGYQFIRPKVSTLQLRLGDMLIFATDGVDPYFLDGISLEDSCQNIANSIINQHGKSTDDALVLVIRIIEGPE